MQLYEKNAHELAKLLREGKCSAAEITKSVFDRIQQVEPKIDAFITITREHAEKQAAAVDAKLAAGETLHPLAGIPVGIKDNISTKDVLTTCASKMLHNYVPPYNATVVNRLDAAGAVMPGKLNMDEFAMGSSCETSYFKKSRNPWNTEYVPGGSSGGSAATVAAGECVLALGSDTGGSIRQPSAYCGIVGLKPTYGAVSRYGLVAFASSLDQIGPMGRCVEDVALLFDTIGGKDPMDATSANHTYPDIASSLNGDVSGLKIGLPKEYFGEGVEPYTKELVMRAAKELESRGATLKEISLPSTGHALSAYYIISSAEASSNLARFDGVKYGYRTPEYSNLLELYEKSRSEGFGDEVQRRILLGTFVLSSGYYDAYYNRAKLLQRQLTQEFNDAFADCDLILTPTTPSTAFKMGERIGNPVQMYANDICTVPVNIAGLPAISVPCGFEAGLPVGLQLIGPRFSEQLLLNTAYCYQNIVGGFRCMPEQI